MSGDRKVREYVEARRELDALKAQLEAADGDDRAAWLARWGGELANAKVRAQLAYGKLNGGELARAQRALREEVWA